VRSTAFERGIITRDQSVLQRGVNDRVDTMRLLVKRLGHCQVHPYYVYVHDLVKGVEDLRTTLQTALDIEKSVRGVTAGFHTPTFVVDAPGGGGYIPCRCRRSARLSAVARTRMRTSAGPSAGRGASPRTSTVSSPGSRMMMARMAISLSMARPGCQRYKPSVMTLVLASLALVLAG
jgi:hypothetical protein